VRAAEDLLGAYQHRIDELSLRPGPAGIFDVTVDDELIFSKHARRRHAQPGEVLTLFTDIIGPDIPRYGT